jgi:hypothetical protein
MKKIVTCFLLVSSLCSNAQKGCDVVKDVDKFTEQISIKTPLECGFKICPLIFGKLIKKEDTTYYLHFYLKSSSASYTAKGIYVIFEDGEKWIKEDAVIETSYASSGLYSYRSQLNLSHSDIERLSKFRITDIRLWQIDYEVTAQEGKNLICSLEKVMKQ